MNGEGFTLTDIDGGRIICEEKGRPLSLKRILRLKNGQIFFDLSVFIVEHNKVSGRVPIIFCQPYQIALQLQVQAIFEV